MSELFKNFVYVTRCGNCIHNIVLDEKKGIYCCYLFSLKHQNKDNYCSWAEKITEDSIKELAERIENDTRNQDKEIIC